MLIHQMMIIMIMTVLEARKRASDVGDTTTRRNRRDCLQSPDAGRKQLSLEKYDTQTAAPVYQNQLCVGEGSEQTH